MMHTSLTAVLMTVTLALLPWTSEAARPTFPEPTSPFLSANQIAALGYAPNPTPGPEPFELNRRADLSNTCGFNNGTAGVTCAPNYYCTSSASYFGCCAVNGAGSFNCSLFTACVDYNDISAACPEATCSYPITQCPSSAPECATFLITTSSDTFSLAYSNFVCSTSKTILLYSPMLEQSTKVQTSVQTSVKTSVQTSVQTVTATPSTSYTIISTSTLTFTSSSPPPSTIAVAPTSTPGTAAGASASSTSNAAPVQKSTSSSHTGAIAGGVVGGVVGLALIGALVAFILYRMKKKREEADWDDAPEMSGTAYPT